MRFQIKKLLEGYDPADLIEQSMYCFGSDGGTSDDGLTFQSDESLEARERAVDQATGNFGGDRTNVADPAESIDFASNEIRQNYAQDQADIRDRFVSGQALGANLNNIARDMPSVLSRQDFAREQDFFDANPNATSVADAYTSRMEDINVGAGDIFGLKNQIANKLSQGGKAITNTQGDIIGATGQTPLFGIPFLPNVTTYTGLASGDPFANNQDFGDDNNNPMTVAPTTNPVSGQPVCPDGYKFDDDLQACRLDTAKPNMGSGTMGSGDAFYRATSLDQAPMNVPSGFDFNRANQDFVSQFAYRPANFTNQMSLTGFTPFRRS